jgi:hypothetical protein
MKRIVKSLAFALPFALLLGAAIAPAGAQTNDPPKNNDVSVYQQGDKFLVVASKADGSATMAVIEMPNAKPDASGKAASRPDIADLIKNGKVTYTVRVAPNGTPAAQATDKAIVNLPAGISGDPAAEKDAKGKSDVRLTRQQKFDLIKRIKMTAQVLETVGKGMAKGSEDANSSAARKR